MIGNTELTAVQSALAFTVPVTIFLLSVWALHARYKPPSWVRNYAAPITALLILGTSFTSEPVLLTGLLMVALVAVNVANTSTAVVTEAR